MGGSESNVGDAVPKSVTSLWMADLTTTCSMNWMHTQTVLTFMILIMNCLCSGRLLQCRTVKTYRLTGTETETVQRLFRGVKERKSPDPGPDGIGGRVLRNCAEQLADIFSFIFSWSLKLHRVPRLWKDSVIVPVPKNKSPTSLNNFRTVALTSLVMWKTISWTQSRQTWTHSSLRIGQEGALMKQQPPFLIWSCRI